MKKNAYLIIALTACTFASASARSGMWIPSLLKQLNEADLKRMGLELPVEELYAADKGALNDAIVQFGGGCTAEIVSGKGLLLTNHHCGFSQIQSLSTLEKNYLDKGYWAMTEDQELACPGLTVTFIREITEVTGIFEATIYSSQAESDKNTRIRALTDSLEKSNSGNGRKAIVRPFYGGNRYFLFSTETFKDIRLVGTPPQSVGNFGGETDNWVWPRHTADFSVFRIYSDKNNRPADYSKDNIPYTPKRFLKINKHGVHEGDFTMVYGFPGRTQQYLPAAALSLIEHQTNPNRIALRDIRMNVYSSAMAVNDTLRLQYAGKFKSLANSYKRWKGELIGLRRDNVIKLKKEAEEKLTGTDKELIDELNRTVFASAAISNANDYYAEGYSSIELMGLCSKFKPLVELCNAEKPDENKIRESAKKLAAELESFYKSYDARIDSRIASAILEACNKAIPDTLQPDFIFNYRKNPEAFTERLFKKSLFTQPEKIEAFLNTFSPKRIVKITSDPAWIFYLQCSTTKAEKIDKPFGRINEQISFLQRQWIKALMDQKADGLFPADANSTLRLSYGKIQPLSPFDGIKYDWQTTADGVLEKSLQDNPDFKLDSSLEVLLRKKEFGSYSDGGKLPVAFIASNHTTGGNSGSPVLNAKGELIGINFDRIWEGVMSDLYYDPALSRNVAVDIRYVLFIIDRLGGCGRLIDEMSIN